MPPQQSTPPQQPAQPTPPTVTSSPPPPTATSQPQSASSSPASTDYPVKLSAQYPDKQGRGLAFLGIIGIRALILLPHIIVLYLILIASGIASFINFFIILFTGKSSEGIHKFMVGAIRWSSRISAYSMGVTDKYPPFKLDD